MGHRRFMSASKLCIAALTLLSLLFIGCEKPERQEYKTPQVKSQPSTEATPAIDSEKKKRAHAKKVRAGLEELSRLPKPTPTEEPFAFTTPTPDLSETPAPTQVSESIGEDENLFRDVLEEVQDEQNLFADDPSSITIDGNEDLGQDGSNNQRNNPGFIGLIRNDDRAEAATPAPETVEEESDEPTPTPTPTQSETAIGYTMLYLMQPGARATVEAELQNLIAADIEHKFLSVLIDGTFSWNFQLLSNAIRSLNASAERVTLVLYISNGATQRSYDSTPIEAPFVQTSPEIFRELIKLDPRTRNDFQELARRARPLFILNGSLGDRNRNVAIPMLEDNLDSESYAAIRQLTLEVVGDTAYIARNPCPGCFIGSDRATLGDPEESHIPSEINQLSSVDGFSLDGTGVRFENEVSDGKDLSVEEVTNLARQALSRNLRYFGLWRRSRQGLSNGALIHPRDRSYEVPTSEQLIAEREIIELAAN